MKIGIDAGCLVVTDKRLKVGVYQLTFSMLRELGKIDENNRYLLYSFQPIAKEILGEFGPQMKNIVVGPKLGWRYFGLPKKLLFDRPDIFIGPSQALPIFTYCPSVVIVHDLSFEHFPACYPDSLQRLRTLTTNAVKKADKIVAVSNSAKKDLIKIYHVPPEKITVVYEDYNPLIKRQSQESVKKVKRKYKIEGDYFLFAGSLKRIKNVPRILEAFAGFLKAAKKKDFFLVLAGGDLWPDPEIDGTIQRLKLEKRVKKLGFVEDEDLSALYSGAIAFISPSLYEGFGLTLLEAMVCGCPVIAGNGGSQPEVVGKAGVLVDPQSVAEISSALLKISTDTLFRSGLIRAGLERATLFSWEKFAKEIYKIFQNRENSL